MELKEKEAFYGLYYGQKVLRGIPIDEPWTFRRVSGNNIIKGIVNSYLELKSLEDITNEHALWAADRIFVKDYLNTITAEKAIEKAKNHISNSWYDFFKTQERIDFFRGNGYALDWTNSEGRTYTVAELVAEGVVKLKTKDQ